MNSGLPNGRPVRRIVFKFVVAAYKQQLDSPNLQGIGSTWYIALHFHPILPRSPEPLMELLRKQLYSGGSEQ